jgi:hypothetical protein
LRFSFLIMLRVRGARRRFGHRARMSGIAKFAGGTPSSRLDSKGDPRLGRVEEMIDLCDSIARLLFEKLGASGRRWDELSSRERDVYNRTAQDVLARIASAAPFDADTLVEKMRETRPTRLGFLYMTYSLNRAEAAALLAARTGLPRRRSKPAA